MTLSKFIIGISLVLVGAYYFLNKQATEKDIKKLANAYNVNYSDISDIKILKSYEDKGKLVYVLEIKGSICEMTTIETERGLASTSISCTR